MSVIIIIILLLLGLFGIGSSEAECSSSSDAAYDSSCTATDGLVWIGDIEGVILPSAIGADLVQADEYWEPQTADIELAEAAIADQEGRLDHRRQYVGFVEDGESKIFINGFCEDVGLEWQREAVVVLDGGDCFFQATFNVDTGELEAFSFNGEA